MPCDISELLGAEMIMVFLVFEYSLELMIEYSRILVACSHTHLTCSVPTLNILLY